MIDRSSMLFEANGRAFVRDVEASFAIRDLTLGLDPLPAPDVTVADWLASGARGAANALLDPCDHLVAGFTGRLHDGREIVVRPSPRRAVGPDLAALFLGQRGRFGVIERAWLRGHQRSAPRPTMALPTFDLDPPVSADEEKLLEAIERSLRAPT